MQPLVSDITLGMPLGWSFVAACLLYQEVLIWVNPPWPRPSLASF